MKKTICIKEKKVNFLISMFLINGLIISIISSVVISPVNAQKSYSSMQEKDTSSENLFIYLGDKVESAILDYNAGNISAEEYASIMNDIKLFLNNESNYQKMKDDEKILKGNSPCPFSSSCTTGGSDQETSLYFGKVTGEEISLCAKHPFKCNTANSLATKASKKTQSIYDNYVLWQGNGDAFRHAYWSALMTKHIDRDFAYDAGLAHEGLKRGYNFDSQYADTKMDISNNYSGRIIGDNNKSKSDDQIGNILKKEIINGNLKRIRTYTSVSSYIDCYIDGVPTKYVGYYVPTSDGGLRS